jgi:pimeloyl-ACP methyl ester carboxylesterase
MSDLMNEHFRDTPLGRLRYLSRPGRPCILFVHGLSRCGDDFGDAADHPALADFGLLAPDLLGHGKSDKPDQFDYNLADQADLVADLMQQHETGPAVVLGHSMGGGVVVLLARRHPELVAKLILAEGNLTPADGFWSRRIIHEFDEANFQEEWHAARENFSGIYATMRMHAEPDDRLHQRVLEPGRQCPHWAAYRTAHDLVTRTCQPAWLNETVAGLVRSGLPVHAISGDATKELATSPERLQAVGIQTHVVPRAGHMMMLDNPAHFFALIAGIART